MRMACEKGMWRLFGGRNCDSLIELTWPRRRRITRGYRSGGGYWYIDWMPLALEVGHHHERRMHLRISGVLFQVFIGLPFTARPLPLGEIGRAWGFSLRGEAIHLHWGLKSNVLRWPWDWVHHETRWRLENGSWWIEPKGINSVERRADMPLWEEALPYRYPLTDGTVQERTAHVWHQRMTWKRKCLPFLRKSRTMIDVKFSDEVGERTGSWKGGTIGCDYTMKPGETPEQCLRRMERERAFD